MLKFAFGMKVRFFSFNFVLAICLLAAVPGLRAQDGVQGALAFARNGASSAQAMHGRFAPVFAIADLDSDNQPDGVVLLDAGSLSHPGNFQIELHFTGHNNAAIAFQSTESALTITIRDIDHDGDVDLVLEKSFTHQPLRVWINNGHGDFEKGRLEDYPGAVVPAGRQIRSSEPPDSPALSLPPQGSFESILTTCHIAGRPPSLNEFAVLQLTTRTLLPAFSTLSSRAPPLA